MSEAKDIIDRINRIIGEDSGPKLVIALTDDVRKKVQVMSLVEGKTYNYKGIPVRVDSARPEMNFPRHAHTDHKGGQISYTDTGQRYHPGKFPNQVPNSHRDAIRWALKLGPDVKLEGSVHYDEFSNELFLLLEDVS